MLRDSNTMWDPDECDPLGDLKSLEKELKRNMGYDRRRFRKHLKQEEIREAAENLLEFIGDGCDCVKIVLSDGTEYVYYPETQEITLNAEKPSPEISIFPMDEAERMWNEVQEFMYKNLPRLNKPYHLPSCDQLFKNTLETSGFYRLKSFHSSKRIKYNRKCFMRLKTFRNIRKRAA